APLDFPTPIRGGTDKRKSSRSWPSIRPNSCSQSPAVVVAEGPLPLTSPGMNERGKGRPEKAQGALPTGTKGASSHGAPKELLARYLAHEYGGRVRAGFLPSIRRVSVRRGIRPRRRRRLPRPSSDRKPARAAWRRSTACIRPAGIRQKRATYRTVERNGVRCPGTTATSRRPADQLSTFCPPQPPAISTPTPRISTNPVGPVHQITHFRNM